MSETFHRLLLSPGSGGKRTKGEQSLSPQRDHWLQNEESSILSNEARALISLRPEESPRARWRGQVLSSSSLFLTEVETGQDPFKRCPGLAALGLSSDAALSRRHLRCAEPMGDFGSQGSHPVRTGATERETSMPVALRGELEVPRGEGTHPDLPTPSPGFSQLFPAASPEDNTRLLRSLH